MTPAACHVDRIESNCRRTPRARPTMTIRRSVLMIGALAGVSGAALVLAAVATLDRHPGAALGLLAATAVGALAARFSADLIGHRLAAHLAQLDDQSLPTA